MTAQRVGDAILLSWMTSPRTTDGDGLRGPVVAVICRQTFDAQQAAELAGAPPPPKPKPSAAKPVPTKGSRAAKFPAPPVGPQAGQEGPPCNPIQRFAVAPGESRAVELLPPPLRAGAPALLGYKVELLNDHERSAGPSLPVYAAAGAAPPATGSITLHAQKAGVTIEWRAQPGGAQASSNEMVMEVRRTLLSTVPGSPAALATHSRGTQPAAIRTRSVGTGPQPGKSGNLQDDEPVVLETDLDVANPLQAGMADPGGMIDATALDGGQYAYVAQRVLRVSLAGRMLELRGEASTAATLLYRDVFPPAAPTGLAAVPGGGFGQPPSVDLSWDSNPEADVAGYFVYRAPLDAHGNPSESLHRLNASALPAPAYRDLAVRPGESFEYTVTAVDRLGNESGKSVKVRETVEAP